MRPKVDVFGGVPPRRVERQHTGAGLSQAVRVRRIRPRADAVGNERHVHAAPRGTFERVGERLRDLAGVVDVGLEVDPATRPVDGPEHRGKELVAVREDLVAIPTRERRAHQRGHETRAARIFGGDLAAHKQCFLILSEQQTRGDDQRGPKQDDQGAAERICHVADLCNYGADERLGLGRKGAGVPGVPGCQPERHLMVEQPRRPELSSVSCRQRAQLARATVPLGTNLRPPRRHRLDALNLLQGGSGFDRVQP